MESGDRFSNGTEECGYDFSFFDGVFFRCKDLIGAIEHVCLHGLQRTGDFFLPEKVPAAPGWESKIPPGLVATPEGLRLLSMLAPMLVHDRLISCIHLPSQGAHMKSIAHDEEQEQQRSADQ